MDLADARLQSPSKKVRKSFVLLEWSGGLLNLDSIKEAEEAKEGGSQEYWHLTLAHVAWNSGLYACDGDEQFVVVIRFQKFVDKDDVEYLTDHFKNEKIFQVATVEKTFLP